MLKRFNMLALIVLLVFQTMLAPVAATAQGLEQEEPKVDTTAENQEIVENVEVSEENDGSENEESDADEEGSAEDGTSGGENEDSTNDDVSEENVEDEETDVNEEETVIEESQEDAEVTSEKEVEDDTPKKRAVPLNDAPVELGNIFEFEYFKINGEDVENGAEIEFDTEYQLQYKWDTNDIDGIKAGDIARLPLPDVFEHWPENTPSQPIRTSDGTVVGDYTVHSGELVFVFDEDIENAAVQNGFVGFNVTFDNEKFIEVWEQEIDFDGSGKKDLTVVVKPNEVETKLEKEGQPDTYNNAREITWSVDITNGNEEAITNGVLKDILPEGVGEPRDFVVREFTYDFNGNKVLGDEVDSFNEPTINGNEFELKFDNVPARGGYTVEYKTTITDKTSTQFTNDATFTAEDVNLDAKTTVTIGERSNPIQKSGWYDSNEGQIKWTIVVNENGEEIDNAIVHDQLPPGLTLVDGSISVTKNWNEVEGLDTTGFPITPIELGKVNADEVYRISFSTEIDWSEVNDGEYTQNNSFTNETELTDGEDPIGEDDATVDVWRERLLSKSGNANDCNYDDKVLSWTLDVNKAKHPISNAVITDIIPAGLDIEKSDIVITNEAGDLVSAENITITTLDDGRTEVTIELGDIGTETLQINYQTEVENFEPNDFKNEASLDGEGIGEDIPRDDATISPPGNSFTKDSKGIDYNAKTMDWNITVDPSREAITELTIEDTFPVNGMILLPESVTVNIGDTVLEEGTDYTLVPNTVGEETGYNKGFTINFTNISEDSPLNERLTVDFKTSYDPQVEVDGNTLDDHEGDPTLYKNHADFTGKTVNGNDIEKDDDAETKVRDDSWNSGKKEGQLVHVDEEGNLNDGWESGSERKVAWQLYTNYQEQDLGTDVVVTDVLGYEGIIDEESIVVKIYNVDPEGETEITSTELSSEDYTVIVEEGGAEFSLEFIDSVTERYVIEFTTTVPDISEESYTNEAFVKVGDNEYPFSGTVNYDKWNDNLDKQALGQGGNEVFIGEELEWEVTVNESLSIIKNATIKDTISAGLAYLEDSLEITTGSETELVEGDDYTLTVTTTDAGETVLDIDFTNDVTEALTLNYTTVVVAEDGQQVNNKVDLNGDGVENQSKETNRLSAKQFSWVGGEYNPNRGAIVVKKVDSDGNVIETGEATFELYFEMNDERVLVGEYSTQGGTLEIPNLPLRTYYLVEVAAPEGYVLTDQEIEVVVDKAYGSNQDVFDVTVTNYKEDEEPEPESEPVEVSVEKVWEDADNQDGIRSESITVNLLANGEVETSKDLNEENNWSHVFTDLPAVDEDGNDIEYTVEEVQVPNYTSEVTVDDENANAFTITNTHEPELINVGGTKTWDDADNQDGARPESITVNLLANGEEIEVVEVTEEDEWKYSFTDLPKFENGEEINYTVQEDDVEDYSSEIVGFDITNSYTPDQTSVNVVKAWEDAQNQDGLRPDSVTVKLLADGEETGKELILTAENNWQGDFVELDVYTDGEEIEYTIEEVAVTGYEVVQTGTAEDGYALTNIHEPELIDLAGTKTWDDADNQDGVRPVSITVNLLANGTEVDNVEVTAETDWTFEFTDLPKFENGEEINYTIQEDDVEDYSTEINGFDITNSYTPGQTSINVVKAWEDADNQDGIRPNSVTVKLFADGEETGQEVELSEENNWQADFTELDVYADGEEVVYTVEEVVVKGYETSVSGTSEDGFVITNTHEPELINVVGTKTWEDADNQDGTRPESITVNLLANGEKIEVVEVTEEDEWKYSFTDLPKFENGEEINYTIQEDDVEEYSTEINGFDITNSYTPGQTSINVVKAWDDAENKNGDRPDSITVQLFADGEATGQEVELNADNNWQADFTDLDVNKAGEAIEYTVEEVAVDGYNIEITGNAKEGFIITNTQKTYAIGDYTWIDSNKDGIQDEDEEVLPGVIVELYDESGENKLDETTTDKNGLYIFDELPAGKYTVKFTLTDEQKEKYIFTKQNADDNSTKDSDADPKTGFTKVIELNDENEHLTKDYTDQDFEATEGIDPTWDAGVIEKTPITPIEPAKTKVSVEKVWKGEAQDKVTINLLADGKIVDSVELLEENDWKHTFTGLPTVNDITDEQAVEYTVEEVAVDGYNTEVTGGVKEGFTITNTQKTYAIGDYTWIDSNKDGIQDENEEVLKGVIVELYDESGENKLAETTTDEDGLYIFDELPAGKYTVKFTLTDEQKEKYEFTKQNAGNDSTVDSDADPKTGFTKVIELNDENEHLTKDYTAQDFKATEGIDPTWDAGVIEKTPITPIEPAKTKVFVEKVWKGEAQDSVTINLFADGEKVDSIELSKDNDWKHTFTDLPTVYEITDEKAIDYTVEEEVVEGYRASITGDAKEGFTITNTQKTYAIGDYTWIDANKDGIQDEDEEVLPGVKVELYDENGEKIAETETDENGFYIFDELPAGKYKVKFTLTEEQAKKYEFTKQNAGDDSTVDSDADENGWTIEFTLDDENEYLTKDYTNQDFKATEGIDPTWDAGVIVKVTTEEPQVPEEDPKDPEDPEKPTPEDPKDPEEPQVPKDPEDPKVGGTEGELPKTATNIYNLTLIGFGLMLLGMILFIVRRKRVE